MNYVHPFRSLVDIVAIKWVLRESPKELALFTIGINTAFRSCDLLRIKAKDVRNPDGSIKDALELGEQKTKKRRWVSINQASKAALEKYFDSIKLKDDDYLFHGKDKKKPITRCYMYKIVQKWVEKARVPGGPYGNHSLRKTWGFMARTMYGIPIERIMQAYNHASIQDTMRYVGITDEEIKRDTEVVVL